MILPKADKAEPCPWQFSNGHKWNSVLLRTTMFSEARKLNGLWDTMVSAGSFWKLRNERKGKCHVITNKSSYLTGTWAKHAYVCYKSEPWAVNGSVHIILKLTDSTTLTSPFEYISVGCLLIKTQVNVPVIEMAMF